MPLLSLFATAAHPSSGFVSRSGPSTGNVLSTSLSIECGERVRPTTDHVRSRRAHRGAGVLCVVRGFLAVMARIRTVFADKSYDAEPHRELCRAFGAEPRLDKRGRPRGSGLGKRRSPVERSNAWLLEKETFCAALRATASY